MSEGLTAVRQLSWALTARWSRGAHASEISEAHFQIEAIFINKPQIGALNNYVLDWNTLRTAFHDTITVIFFTFCGFSRSLIGAKCILGYRPEIPPPPPPPPTNSQQKKRKKAAFHDCMQRNRLIKALPFHKHLPVMKVCEHHVQRSHTFCRVYEFCMDKIILPPCKLWYFFVS